MSHTSHLPTTNLAHFADDRETRRIEHHEAEVLIVGAGIIGSALAVALGKQGRSVILLEKNLSEPHRIVGELLQPGGVAALEQLGLRHCLEGIDAIPVQGYEIIYHGESVLVDDLRTARADAPSSHRRKLLTSNSR